MIQRIRSYTKPAPSRDARKLYIICEGNDTEPNYFNFLKGLTSNLSIIPIPSEDGKTDPVKLKEWAETHLLQSFYIDQPDYLQNDLVWFVIDTDLWQEQGKVKILRDFCDTKNAELVQAHNGYPPYLMWNVAQSNPQFELWHYYHIYSELPNHEDVEQYVTFKDYVANKIHGGFNPIVHAAYMRDAITHSERNFQVDAERYPLLYTTEVHLFCKQILPFVQRDLEKLRNKLSL